MLDSLLFYCFAGVAVLGAVLMISRRNPMHAAFFLTTTLLATGGIFLELRAGVLFRTQIILYAGGVTALFVSVLLLVRSGDAVRQVRFGVKKQMATAVAVALGFELMVVLFLARRLPGGGLLVRGSAPVDQLPPNAVAMATSLFGDYLLPFEMTSVLLLVAMVGAVVMAKNRRRHERS